MTARSALLLAAAALTLAACQTVPARGPAGSAETFRAEDFAWSQRAGTATVAGVVAAGRTCAGSTVGLTPETAFSRARIQRLYGSTTGAVRTVEEVRARQVAEAGADYSAYVRTARCGDDDRFRFEGLPDGAWYAIVRARPQGQAAGASDVVLMRRVETRAGRTTGVTF